MAKQPIAAVILAAGKGLRMKSSLPKVLHKVGGRAMLERVVTIAASLKPKSITVVVGPGMKAVEQAAKRYHGNIQCVIQPVARGTGDAVRQTRKQLKGFKGTVLVLFADTPFITEKTIKAMVKEASDHAVVVLGFRAEDPMGYGRLVRNKKGKLEAIVECKDATPAQRKIDFCNAGIMAIDGSVMFELLDALDSNNSKNEFYLTDIIAIANEKGYHCSTLEAAKEEVMGINSKQQLSQAEGVLQEKLRQQAMEQGVTLIAPETVFLHEDTKFGQDVVVHPYVVFGPGVTLKDGVEIKSFSHIEGATIRNNASIGPYARLRAGSDIGEECRVGNFVEVKKSTLGNGTKASHLSYIGDTVTGKDVNIGAGTITCNYDGKKKHKTSIKDGVFVGSNTSLVAPVTVGKNAVIGAGSTITKDVAAGATVINDMPQKKLK